MTEKIYIRTAQPQDAKALLEIYAPYVENTAITFEYTVPTVREFEARIEKTLQKYPYLAAYTDTDILGYAYAGVFHERAAYDWAVETSIYIRQDKRRLGAGRALYDALEKALMAQGILNLNACVAYAETQDPYLTNDSVSFHERLGYHMTGKFHQCGYKFNRWYNMVWLEKHIGEHTAEQPPVKPFKVIEKDLPWLNMPVH